MEVKLVPGMKYILDGTNQSGWNTRMQYFIGRIVTILGLSNAGDGTVFIEEDAYAEEKHRNIRPDGHWYWNSNNFVSINFNCIFANDNKEVEQQLKKNQDIESSCLDQIFI